MIDAIPRNPPVAFVLAVAHAERCAMTRHRADDLGALAPGVLPLYGSSV